jgi:electron transfer flavoprotein beta subunit
MKETPSTTAEKRFTAEMRLERRREDAIPNPFDEYAIEEGLRQQEKHPESTVTIVCMGPATAAETIRKALAMGGDRGVLVSDPALAGSDAIGTGRVLAAALEKIGYDLVIFGSAAAAYGGVVPSAVAEFLNKPLLSYASQLDMQGDKARIQRQAETLSSGDGIAARSGQRGEVHQRAAVSLYERYYGFQEKAAGYILVSDLGLDPAAVGGALRVRRL